MYGMNGYTLFRNDGKLTANNTRSCHGTAVYSRLDYYPGFPYCNNSNGIEITVTRFLNLPHISIIGIYNPPRTQVIQLCQLLTAVFDKLSTNHNIFIGDLNVNWFNKMQRAPLQDVVTRKNYRQLICC